MPARKAHPPAAPSIEGLERRLCFTTWFVAPDGLDVYPGTQNAPLASLAGAAAVARAGDVVYVMAGIYSPTRTQVINSLGAADGHVTFEPYPGQTAIIDGSSLPAGSPAVNITGSYIDFENFEVRNSRGAGVQVAGQDIQVIGNTFDGNQQQGILVGSSTSLTATGNVLVQSNYIYNNDLANSDASTAVSGAANSGLPDAPMAPLAAAQTDGAGDVNFAGNYIHDNYGVGLDLLLLDGGDVSTNVIHDNAGAQVVLDNATNLTVQQNFIYNTSEAQFYIAGEPAVSIELTNGLYISANPLNQDRIQNNIVLFGGINLQYSNLGSGAGMQNTIVANNDFYAAAGATGVNVSIDASAGFAGNLMVDNIFDQPTGTQSAMGGGADSSLGLSGFVFEYNNWFQGPQSASAQDGAGIAAGSGDVYTDPLLGDPGSIDPAAYKLSASSPDVDAAIPVAGVTVDYYDVPRPQGKAPDIGAHELIQGAETSVPTPTPVTPGPGGGIPANLAATAPNPYEIDLTWGDPYGTVTGFAVQRRSANGWVTIGFAGDGPASGNYIFTGFYVDTGLKANHSYTYRVRAFFQNNTVSAVSKKLTFKTPKAPKPPKVHKPKAAKPAKKANDG